ncbi:unnamed protein product, partial [Onchocerca flexuosa]|uniref:SCY1-like protein 2 n=1 Tax=Onchocerca flexuosa TaxID=387005 RepID=A0A183HNV5_9BILA
MVTDQIIPALPKVISREPAILMAILGIYKLAYEESRFGITREQCAKSILPFLIASSMENTLNMPQFEQYMALIHRILNRIEKDQRQRLQQLSASQEEQRSVGEFADIFGQSSITQDKNSLSDGLSDLVIEGSIDGKTNGVNRNAVNKGPLSLSDKKRLAAEREQNLRLRSQPNLLQPVSAKESINKSQSTKNSLWPDPFEMEPNNSLNSIILPSQSTTCTPSQPDSSKTKPDNLLESFMLPNQSNNYNSFWPNSSETKPDNSLTSFMLQSQPTNFNSLWPDPFKMELDKSSASFLLQPAVSLPGPPVVQNPVV